MARTRTLDQLRADVCERADVADGGTTGRHTTAFLNRHINQAIQQFTRLVTGCGCDTYIKQATANTSVSATVDTANWAPRDYIAMPADFYHLRGIDITNGASTIPMFDFMMVERNVFKCSPVWLANPGVGMPVFYKLGGTNQAGSRVAKIIPSADAVYACVIWYLPTPADLVSGSDTFDGIAGFEEWVVNRAAMDCLTRDRARYAELDGDNEQLRRNMVFEFAAAQGPGRRQDTETLRKRFATYVSGDWWAP